METSLVFSSESSRTNDDSGDDAPHSAPSDTTAGVQWLAELKLDVTATLSLSRVAAKQDVRYTLFVSHFTTQLNSSEKAPPLRRTVQGHLERFRSFQQVLLRILRKRKDISSKDTAQHAAEELRMFVYTKFPLVIGGPSYRPSKASTAMTDATRSRLASWFKGIPTRLALLHRCHIDEDSKCICQRIISAFTRFIDDNEVKVEDKWEPWDSPKRYQRRTSDHVLNRKASNEQTLRRNTDS